MAESPNHKDNAVILHHPDAVDTSREKLMGRHAAGAGFLKGFAEHARVERFYCQVLESAHADDFARRIRELAGGAPPCAVVTPDGMPRLPENARTLYTPDPSIGLHAWRRRPVGARAYSICGINHTVASDIAMDGVAALLTGPVQPWDAVICTSRAVKAVLVRMLDNYADFLGRRGGGSFTAELKMPVIPLGVDCARFLEGEPAARVRGGVRRGLGIGDDDFAALYFGRLSFHAKAHPLPMYLALEAAARRTGKRVHLIQTGRFANDGIEREFRDGARTLCPSVNPIFLDGRDDDVCRDVWYAADAFVSLSDNVQESFGLTPIEAMAAGLPCVVTDWNGYRDTVRDGIDGFALPTWMPLPGSGGDLVLHNDGLVGDETRDRNYNHYCGVISQCTAVDTAKAADAVTALVENPDLRRRMGASGRARARAHYDWSVIINAYQDLWRELGHIRNRADEIAPPVEGRPVHPLRDDPFSLFAGYASATVDGETTVALTAEPGDGEPAAGERLAMLRVASMNDFAAPAMLPEDDLKALLAALEEDGPLDVFSLAERFEEANRFRLPRTLSWLAKLGIVQLSADDTGHGQARIEPEDTETRRLVDLGLAARRRGAMQAAVEYFEKALRTDPGDVEANIQVGEVLAGHGRLDTAITAFRRALGREPDRIDAMRNLGKALFLKGDEKGGIEIMTGTVARAPEDAESRFLLGAAYRRTGDVNKAIRELERCVGLDETRGDALFHLGLAHKTVGRAEPARDALRAALKLDRRDVYAKAALANMEFEERGRRHLRRNPVGRRIALHLSARGQYPVLRPVLRALRREHWPIMTCDGRELQEFGPAIVIMAGGHTAALRQLAPDAVIVNVGPGLTSKNFLGRVRDPGDFLCAAGPRVADEVRERRGLAEDKVWATGYPAMDALFKAEADAPRPARRRVLYAPTDRASLSSVGMIGAEITARLLGGRDDVDLVIRPHPRHLEQAPPWLAAWRAEAARHDHVTLADNPSRSVAPLLLDADVLVSDASSVMFEYLALNRPMVLLSNPDRFDDRTHFDAAGHEWMWRDMGEEVHDPELLAEAVGRALAGADPRADIRANYRAHMFGDLVDGRAARRIARQIAKVPL